MTQRSRHVLRRRFISLAELRRRAAGGRACWRNHGRSAAVLPGEEDRMAKNSEAARRSRSIDPAEDGATIKDPPDLHAGREAMTQEQANYLKILAHEAGEPFDPDLTRAMAARRIRELEQRTGRAP
jgi:hypothetical protein